MDRIKQEPDYILKSLSPVRKAIANRVCWSFKNIPQFDLHMDVDASAFVQAKEAILVKAEDIIPSYNDMFIFCACRALEKFPELNAHFTDEGIKEFKEVNIGFAVATPEGVLVPVIRCANAMNLQEIAKSSSELIKLAKNGRLRSSLQTHATFTISSLGAFGIDSFNAIINPPQVAILAVGSIIKKPGIRDNKLLLIDTLHLTLTVDHRAIDGDLAANFLVELSNKILNFC